jgi:hypothetical protein
MMNCRTGEVSPSTFRSDRLCQINGQWYFVTREKTKEGPFDNRTEASMSIDRYIARMRAHAQT